MCERLGMQCSANFNTCTLRSPAPSLRGLCVWSRAVLLSNRSAAQLSLKQAQAALRDARACLELEPRWSKVRTGDVHGRRAWVARGSYRQGRHFCVMQAHGRMAAALVSLGRWEEAVRESLSTLNRYSCKGSCTRTCIAGRASPLCVAHCDQPQQCWGAGRPEPHTEGLLRVWYRRSSTTRTDCSSSRRAHPSERAWPVPPRAVVS